MIGGTTNGTSAMKPITGRSLGSFRCTQYRVGTKRSRPTTIVSSASLNESLIVVQKCGSWRMKP